MCKNFLHATCNQYNWFSIGWPWGFRHNSMAAQNSMNRKVLDLKAGISKHTAEQVLGSGLKKKRVQPVRRGTAVFIKSGDYVTSCNYFQPTGTATHVHKKTLVNRTTLRFWFVHCTALVSWVQPAWIQRLTIPARSEQCTFSPTLKVK